MKVTVKAYAKVNLSLDITGKRDDGYHTLRSVMQSVSLCDTITITLGNVDGLVLKCSNNTINGEDNLAFKAAKRFFEVAKISPNAEIYIEKAIPLAGGLGGGSVDAAAVLGALNILCDKPICDEKLQEIALSLGADVPFCLNGGTCLAEGIGEVLTKLCDMPTCKMLVAKKGFKNSTGEMYRTLDAAENLRTSNLDLIKKGLEKGNVAEMVKGFYNCFETVCGDESIKVKQIMLDSGALYAGLSGAGPSVIGIFETDEQLQTAKADLELFGAEIFCCVPTDKGFEII